MLPPTTALPESLGNRHLGLPWKQLGPRTRSALEHVAARRVIAREPPEPPASWGQRAADRLAAVLGSWGFVSGFVLVTLGWVLVNVYWLSRNVFDPYPFILLNLVLSMLAALQAPVILMVQSRQAKRDRLQASHDYEINLKAELEVMQLHDKLDSLGVADWPALMATQREQAELLRMLLRAWPSRV